MNEFTEKLIERLEEEYNYQKAKSFEEGIRVGAGEEPKMVTEERCRYKNAQCFDASIQIVEELAKEYNGGWIPCSERLPKLYKTVLIQYHSKINNFDTIVLAHIDSFLGWKIEFGGSCDSDCVIAWQPLPEPYNPKGE